MYVMVCVPPQAMEIEKAAEGVCVSKQVSSVPAQYSVVGVDYTMNIVIPSNTIYNHTEHHVINSFPFCQTLMHFRTG